MLWADIYRGTQTGKEDRKDICTGDDDDLADVPGKKAPRYTPAQRPQDRQNSEKGAVKKTAQAKKIPDRVTLAELDEALFSAF